MPLCSLNLFVDVYDHNILAEANTAGCPSRFLIGTVFQRLSFCVWALELRTSNTLLTRAPHPLYVKSIIYEYIFNGFVLFGFYYMCSIFCLCRLRLITDIELRQTVCLCYVNIDKENARACMPF